MASKPLRILAIAVGSIVLLLLLIAISIPLFLNTGTFKSQIEATLTKSLGRKVTIGKLDLSILSGTLNAQDATVADDPAFNTQPFIQAASVKIRVEVMPLITTHTVHILGFKLEQPKVTLLRGANNTWNYSSLGGAATRAKSGDKDASDLIPNLTVGHLVITGGQITVGSAQGVQGDPSRTYDQVELDVKDFSFIKPFAFNASAHLPGNGTAKVNGTAGPINPANAAATPLEATVDLQHVDLAAGGILPADAGIGGITNLNTKVYSDGQTLTAIGTAHVEQIRLAQNGQPSAKPVDLKYNLNQNMQSQLGTIKEASATIGRIAVTLAGTFQQSGPTTDLRLRANAPGVSIDELQAFLPSLGVRLPTGSRLQGGTLTTTLDITGSSAAPAISGPVQVANTQLAGFDLGQKLQSLSSITGIKPGQATIIRSLTMNLRQQGGAVRTDNVSLDLPALGTATGAGSINAAGGLDYRVILKLAMLAQGGAVKTAGALGGGGVAGQLLGMIPSSTGGSIATEALRNGIPVNIGGTTSNPTFTPDLRNLASGAGKSAISGFLNGQGKSNNNQSNPLGNALGGLFGRH